MLLLCSSWSLYGGYEDKLCCINVELLEHVLATQFKTKLKCRLSFVLWKLLEVLRRFIAMRLLNWNWRHFTLHEPNHLPFDRQTIHIEKDMQKNDSNA